MPTDFAFRFSTHLALALACACLGYAEWEYLPEVSVFAGLVAVALVVAFRSEGKFALSLTAANWVGGGISLVALAWIALHWRRDNSLIHLLPWPAGLLPFLAPLIMVLMPAKLFRPKHVGDWWTMHGVGLATVGLAAALTEDSGFVVLLGLYAVAGVWSLTLFYLRRAAGLIPPVPPATPTPGLFDVGSWFPWALGGKAAPPVVAGPPPGKDPPSAGTRFGRPHVRKALVWIGLTGLVSLPVFFLTPRSTASRLNLGRSRYEVGLSPDAAVDLSRTGRLAESAEPAFDVTVTDAAGRPVDALPGDQLWRSREYVSYTNGTWARNHPAPPYIVTEGVGPATNALPDLGPGTLHLDIRLLDRSIGPILAAPEVYTPGQTAPALTVASGRPPMTWSQRWDGSFRPPPAGQPVHFLQSYVPAEKPRGVPFIYTPATVAQPNSPGPSDPLGILRQNAPLPVASWTRSLLNRLIASGRLPAGAVPTGTALSIDKQYYRAVAEAFREYLAESGEFTYTTELTRQNTTADPVADFLENVKSGHCQRFATALVLMLRSVGVPAVCVLGFKGWESQGDGKYLIRHDLAHAWADALVPTDKPNEWEWLTLDPTPQSSGEDKAGTVSGLWDALKQSSRRFLADYVIGLTPENQQRIAENTTASVVSNARPLLAGVLGTAVLVAIVRRWRRRSRVGPERVAGRRDDEAPWFTRLVAELTRRGVPLAPGVTPREYAAAAAARLPADVAGVPTELAEAVYAARYAGRPLPPDRVAELNLAVDRLAAVE